MLSLHPHPLCLGVQLVLFKFLTDFTWLPTVVCTGGLQELTWLENPP